MSAIDDVFNALLFGSGSWLGLIIILAIILTIAFSTKSRIACAVLALVSILMGVEYFSNVGVSDSFMWSGVIMFITALALVYGAIKGDSQ